MVIGNITSIAAAQANITEAAFLVVILSIFNSGGRVAAGMLSDKIGGVKTLMLAFIMQGINMAMFASFQSDFTLMIGAALAGIGYGTLLAVFPINHCGLLRPEKLRRKLRRTIHGMGHQWVHWPGCSSNCCRYYWHL